MLEQFAMPTQTEVEQTLLRALLKHGGVIKEFGSGQEIVDEMADEFGLNERQRSAFLETIYRKENRVKKSLLWHRLLFRAADALARQNLVIRPTQTLQLTKKREWLLTEKGFDDALKLCKIPTARKEFLPTKAFEVQKIVKKLTESRRTEDYDPFDKNKKIVKTTTESILRTRGFRQAVMTFSERSQIKVWEYVSLTGLKYAPIKTRFVGIGRIFSTNNTFAKRIYENTNWRRRSL